MNRPIYTAAVSIAIHVLLISRLLAGGEGNGGGLAKSVVTLTPKTHPVLLLEGSAYDRGLTHGKQLKTQIHDVVRLWKEDIHTRHGVDPVDFINRFVAKTAYDTAIKKWVPDILDEIRGIADGAEIDFNTMFVFQFVDEYWAQGERIARERCSSLGFNAEEGQPAYVAQTNDLETFRDGFQIVLRIKEKGSDLESLVHSNAGCIGWNGVNNKSIGICVNTVSQLDNCRDGLPVNCIVRGVLMQQSEADAVAFLQRIKHASGANYIVGGPDKVYCFECSAGKVVQFTPRGQENVVWHTNHPLVNDDYNPPYKALLASGQKIEGDENTKTRLECLERRLGKSPAGSRLDLIKATLSSKDSSQHPICGSRGRSGAKFFTFAATIMVLSDQPTLYATFGPPDEAPFEQFSFMKVDR